MEYLLPRLDEFILDFDAEEALLQAQVLAAGQAQAQSNNSLIVSALGSHPLNSELDALRREIARLEQLKQKQGAAKATLPKPSSNGIAGQLGAQKSGSQLPAKQMGCPSGNGAARQGVPAQRQPSAKRVRVGPGQTSGVGASSVVAVKARQPAGIADTSAGIADATRKQPPATGYAPVAPEQPTCLSAGVVTRTRIGSKRPADDAEGLVSSHQQLPPSNLSQSQCREKSLSKSQRLASAVAVPGAARTPLAKQRQAEQQLQDVSHPTASSPFSDVCEDAYHHNDDDGGAGGSSRIPAQLQLQSEAVVGSAPAAQQRLMQTGPGPPRKRHRMPGQQPATSATGAVLQHHSDAAGGSPASSASPITAAGPAVGQAVVAHDGVSDTRTASNSSISTRSGNLAVLGHKGKGQQADLGGGACVQTGSGVSNRGGRGAVGTANGGSDPTSEHQHIPAQSLKCHDLEHSDHSDICPEAEQAANMFLMSLMTQMNCEGQDRTWAAAAEVSRPPSRQDDARRAAAQRRQQQMPAQYGGQAEAQTVLAERADPAGQSRIGDGVTDAGPLADSARSAAAPSTGKVSARQAAAKRTSAAVQRLRRKSSGVAAIEPGLRITTSVEPLVGAASTIANTNTEASVNADLATPPHVTSPPPTAGTVDIHFSAPAAARQSQQNIGSSPARAAAKPLAAAAWRPHPDAAQCDGEYASVAAPVSVRPIPRLRMAEPGAGGSALLAGQSRPGSMERTAEEEAQTSLGAVSSPLTLAVSGGGPCGAAPSLGVSPAVASQMSPWVQAHAGGCNNPSDHAQHGTGLGSADNSLQRLHHLPQPPQPHNQAGAAPAATGATTSISGAPGALAGAGHYRSTTLPQAVPPYGLLPPPVGAHRLPFPQPLLWYPLPLPPGGPFPGGPLRPGMQWRPAPPDSVSLGPVQSAVSLVEVDVLARKELILLKWHMLQDIAAELDMEWVEACQAHNRLRLLCMAQSGREDIERQEVYLRAGGAAEPAAPLLEVTQRQEGMAMALHPHPIPRDYVSTENLPTQQIPLHPQPLPLQQQQLTVQQMQGHRKSGDPTLVQTAALREAPLAQHPPSPYLQSSQDAPIAASFDTSSQMQPPYTSIVRGRRLAPGQAGSSLDRAALQQQQQQQEDVPGQAPGPSCSPAWTRPISQRTGQGMPLGLSCSTHEPGAPTAQLDVSCCAEEHRGQHQHSDAVEGVRCTSAVVVAAPGSGPGLQISGSAVRRLGPGKGQLGGVTAITVQPAPTGYLQPPASVPSVSDLSERPPQQQPEATGPAAVAVYAEAQACISEGCGLRTRSHAQGGCDDEASPAQRPNPAASQAPPRTTAPPAATKSIAATVAPATVLARNYGRAHEAAPLARKSLQVVTPVDVSAGNMYGAGRNMMCGNDGSLLQSQAGACQPPHQPQLRTQHAAHISATTFAAERENLGAGVTNGKAPQAAPPAGSIGEASAAGVGAGVHQGGAGGSAQNAVWTPWAQGDTSVLDMGSSQAEEPHSNADTAGNHGRGKIVEGDGGRDAGSIDMSPPFTGLSFKLSVVPSAGRRVSSKRAHSGTPSTPSTKGVLCMGLKRVSPSVSALVPAPVVQPRGRSLPGIAAAGATASAAAAVAATAAAAVAAVSAMELPLRLQSALQVLSGPTTGSASTPVREDSAGGPAISISRPPELQASQPLGSNSNASAGLRETAAETSCRASQEIAHVQALRAGPSTARYERIPGQTEGLRIQLQQPVQPESRALLPVAQQQSQSHHIREQLGPALQLVPQLASVLPHASSPVVLYQSRRDVLLAERSVLAASSPTSALEIMGKKYTSPLNIFRSYSGQSTQERM